MVKGTSITFVAVVAAFSGACKRNQISENHLQSTDAVDVVRGINDQQLRIINERITVYFSAMPFTYVDDGCFARGLLMSADLARFDVPVEVINHSKIPKFESLETKSGTKWIYHTAPQFYYQGIPYVLDPAHAGYPLTREEWLARNNTKGVPSVISVSERTSLGNSYFGASKGHYDPSMDLNGSVNGVFDPAYLVASVQTLVKFIDQEEFSAQLKGEKKHNLNILVQQTLDGLAAKARLKQNPTINLAGWKDAVKKATGQK